jgi:hypothetical protein
MQPCAQPTRHVLGNHLTKPLTNHMTFFRSNPALLAAGSHTGQVTGSPPPCSACKCLIASECPGQGAEHLPSNVSAVSQATVLCILSGRIRNPACSRPQKAACAFVPNQNPFTKPSTPATGVMPDRPASVALCSCMHGHFKALLGIGAERQL